VRRGRWSLRPYRSGDSLYDGQTVDLYQRGRQARAATRNRRRTAGRLAFARLRVACGHQPAAP
jgi:hypothetical protein